MAPVVKRDASSDKREAILRAALELFSVRGFHGTSVPSVAKEANVGAGTIYRYFANKEALVNALYRQWKGAIASLVVQGFPGDKPARQQFQAIWQKMAQFVFEHPKAFAFLELHHHRSYLDEQSLAIESSLLEFGEGFIRKAQQDKVLRPMDPVLLMALAFGAFVGVVRASWEGKLELTEHTFEAAEQATWELIRA
jgi:AcrR family transcriptional regulator